MRKFPDDFLWGAATAAHQVEGQNTNSDVWCEEGAEGSPYKARSGDAIDHLNRYESDIQLLSSLHLNTYRFGIEWARVEPDEGLWSDAALRHYASMVDACVRSGLVPIITLHHFSSPRWLMRHGGWRGERTPELFARYARKVMEVLGDKVAYVCTINEANIALVLQPYLGQMNFMPPVGANPEAWAMPAWRESAASLCGAQKERYCSFMMGADDKAVATIKEAHRLARQEIRAVAPTAKVGFTLALGDQQSVPGGEQHADAVWHRDFGQWLDLVKDDDFFGVQNYTRAVHGPEGPLPLEPGQEITQMGYEFYPDALGNVVARVASECDVPIIVTESGVATDDDTRRSAFIKKSLDGLLKAIDGGANVKGYCYWSAFDNFEWLFGYDIQFGLVAVDRVTQKRSVKPSARWLGTIARENAM